MDKFFVKEENMLLEEASRKLQGNDYLKARELLADDRAKQGKQVAYDILLAAFLANPSKGIDWYSILQTFPGADVATIELQYRRLVSLLEPIKMGFFGAETALHKVKDAYAVLSNPSRRALFDRERNYTNDWSEQVTLWRQSNEERNMTIGIDGDSSNLSGPVVPYSPKPCEFQSPLDKLLVEETFGEKKRKELDDEVVLIQEKETKITTNISDAKLLVEETFDANKKRRLDEIACAQEQKAKFGRDWSDETQNIKIISGLADLAAPRDFPESDSKNKNDAAPPHQRIKSRKARWSAEDIEAGSVWAVYDDSRDLMPRTYARVFYVVSPTKVRVRFLVPHPSHLGEERWLKEDLPFGCGVFSCVNSVVALEITKFSHPVTYETKETLFRILPCKGEIWAAYEKWSNKWKHHDFSTCKYQVVEILSDYTEKKGISIRSLFNVDNYLSFFHRQSCSGFFYIKDVSKSEILSFSHGIPAYTVADSKEHGFQDELLHLEPDALPLNIVTL